MTMYRSRAPIHDDPEPWKVWLETGYRMHGHREWRGAAADWDDALVRAEEAFPKFSALSAGEMPRAEYVREHLSETNAILVEFRDGSGSVAERAVQYRTYLTQGDVYDWRGHPPEMHEHALRVISRLVPVEA